MSMTVNVREDEKLEFKAGVDLNGIAETVCAFSNRAGGRILVGVSDSGKVIGVTIGRDTIERIVNHVYNCIDPKPIFDIRVVSMDNKPVIVLTVEEGPNKPYFFRGRCVVRKGSTNRVLSRDEIVNLLVTKVTFDSLEYKGEVKIDVELLSSFIERLKTRRRMKVYFDSVENVLSRLGLRNKYYNNAAVLLFSPDCSTIFPQAIIKIGKFRDYMLVDEVVIEGPLIRQVEEALGYVIKNIERRIKVVGLERVEEYEYPVEAIREAIVNAVVHRDYRVKTPVYVKIFEDRIEVSNPGELPPQLTIEDLKKEHPSIPRNPKIARIFYLYGYMEEWGIGTLQMIRACRKRGLPDPEFKTGRGFFKVILKSRKYVLKELNLNERKLYDYIRNRGAVTLRECVNFTGKSERTVHRYLNKLQKLGLIVKIEKGVYKVVKD